MEMGSGITASTHTLPPSACPLALIYLSPATDRKPRKLPLFFHSRFLQAPTKCFGLASDYIYTVYTHCTFLTGILAVRFGCKHLISLLLERQKCCCCRTRSIVKERGSNRKGGMNDDPDSWAIIRAPIYLFAFFCVFYDFSMRCEIKLLLYAHIERGVALALQIFLLL